MVKLENNEELQSLGIAAIELSTHTSKPQAKIKYYVRLKNGSVHGPCEIHMSKLPNTATLAAITFVEAMERAVVEHSLGSDAEIQPSGILTAKEF